MNIGVVGAGIFGLAAAIELQARGHAVTVYEQGTVPYGKASSTDVSKAIRRTWYAGDNETYVELAERAAIKWRQWESEAVGLGPAPAFYHQVGALHILEDLTPGTSMHESIKFLNGRGARVEVLSSRQARTRFPQFRIGPDEVCVYDPWAGYLESGRAVSHLAKLARREGVRIVEETPVISVGEGPSGADVVVDSGPEMFDRVVVSVGVWVGRLLPEVGRHIRVTHQQMVLIEPQDQAMFAHGAMPVWSVDPDVQGWYGFPLLREGYVKVSKEPVGDTVDPDMDRGGTPEFAELTKEFLRERIPAMAEGRVVEGRSCLYANTPDDHLLVDWAPGYSRVLVAGGGSGHGFKFGGSIGEVIADAVEEKHNPLGELFRIGDRFGASAAVRPSESRGFARPAQEL